MLFRSESIEVDGKPVYRLLAGVDGNKDQSYFLCQVSQKQLAYALFPIGELTKPEVRQIAEKIGLATAQRKDSQGICFVGKVDLPTFLQQKLETKVGNIVEVPSSSVSVNDFSGYPTDDAEDATLNELAIPVAVNPLMGKVIGKHNGAHYYTIGQRKGLNIGGYREPLFIIATDTATNTIYVGEGHEHPGLNRKGLFIRSDELHYIRPDLQMQPGDVRNYLVRIRYRQPLQEARLYHRENGLYIIFRELQRGITPGQFAAWYAGDELIGSGVING